MFELQSVQNVAVIEATFTIACNEINFLRQNVHLNKSETNNICVLKYFESLKVKLFSLMPATLIIS